MLNRRRHGVRVLAYFAIELLVLTGTFFVAWWVRQRTAPYWTLEIGPLEQYLWLWPVSLGVWSGLLWGFSTYTAFRTRSILVHGFFVGLVSALGVVCLFALLAAAKQHEVNRSLVGLMGVAGFLGLFLSRLVATSFLGHYTQKGYDRHYVLIGGTHEGAVALARELEGIRGAVFQVRGFVAEDPSETGREVGRWKVLGTYEDIPSLATASPVDEVWLLPRAGRMEDCLEVIEQCESMGMAVHLRMRGFDRLLSRPAISDSQNGSYLTFRAAPHNPFQLVLKRMVDVAGALAMLALFWPVLFVVGVLIRLSSRGPAIFRQERAGMSGRTFTLYKFRTMVDGAEKDRALLESQNEMEGPVFKIKEDPRVTWLGKILRKTSIDELPQLWNVLKGDMSLVGPRPLPTYEVEKFERWQRRRMTMRPGITCLWQVRGRNRVVSFAEWMKMDLEYVDHWSIRLDLEILIKTIPAVLGGKGAY